ncbi:MAG TPA: hypothetical protein VGQ71_03890 [Terriglobales bacterium]|jgi:hypothetical protein|nr:hypothetical protein [Terriglobales bacterium]
MQFRKHLLVLIALAIVLTLALAQQGGRAAVRVLSPKAGEKISNTFVNVKYELAAPVSAAGSPTFQLRLDGRDPVRTTDTEHTFTGLAPGSHRLSIELVDANNTPLPGSRAELQFTVVSGSGRPGTTSGTPLRTGTGLQGAVSFGTQPRLQYASLLWQTNAGGQYKDAQPYETPLLRTSSLPLLSVIGLGVLLGGIASALRTRQSGPCQTLASTVTPSRNPASN